MCFRKSMKFALAGMVLSAALGLCPAHGMEILSDRQLEAVRGSCPTGFRNKCADFTHNCPKSCTYSSKWDQFYKYKARTPGFGQCHGPAGYLDYCSQGDCVCGYLYMYDDASCTLNENRGSLDPVQTGCDS